MYDEHSQKDHVSLPVFTLEPWQETPLPPPSPARCPPPSPSTLTTCSSTCTPPTPTTSTAWLLVRHTCYMQHPSLHCVTASAPAPTRGMLETCPGVPHDRVSYPTGRTPRPWPSAQDKAHWAHAVQAHVQGGGAGLEEVWGELGLEGPCMWPGRRKKKDAAAYFVHRWDDASGPAPACPCRATRWGLYGGGAGGVGLGMLFDGGGSRGLPRSASARSQRLCAPAAGGGGGGAPPGRQSACGPPGAGQRGGRV